MLTSTIFQKVLIDPVFQDDADELFVVTGYATAAMVFHHIQKIKNENLSIKVNLIVGMVVQDGISRSNHMGFRNLMENELSGKFECSYIVEPPPVHSKIYTWFRKGKPLIGFVGSANYSQKAFYSKQRECMEISDPMDGYNYYKQLINDTIYCTNLDVENFVPIYDDKNTTPRPFPFSENHSIEIDSFDEYSGLEHVSISLINRKGIVSPRSGLNWGQRPDYNREPNQAYLPLTSEIYHSDFFPPIGHHFTVYTDDGKILICSRAQQNGKAIHTPHNNSLIGEYFRNRLGIGNGQPVRLEDLQRYGRTTVDFYKIDEEAYYMDFSVK